MSDTKQSKNYFLDNAEGVGETLLKGQAMDDNAFPNSGDLRYAGVDWAGDVRLEDVQKALKAYDKHLGGSLGIDTNNVGISDQTDVGGNNTLREHFLDDIIHWTEYDSGVEDNFVSIAEDGSLEDSGYSKNIFPDMEDPSGFVDRNDSTFSFTDGTRTLSISPVATSYVIYQGGTKYTKTATESVIIPNTEGTHYVYFDLGVLTVATNPTIGTQLTIIQQKVLISIVYWDATNGEGVYVGEERHGIQMDGATHSNLHFTRGLQWFSGIALSDLLVDQNGADNEDAQFGVESGSVADEDLGVSNSAIAKTVGLPVYWRTGANGDWRKDLQAGFSFLNTAAGRPNWNEFTGGVWSQSEVSNNDFMLVHVFATTEKDNPIIAIMGQEEYATKFQAREGATTEINDLLLGNLPAPEIRPIATVILECKDSYGNDVNARIVSTDEGADYVDWRTSEFSRGTAASDHGSLGGLTDDDHAGHPWLIGRAGGQTLIGGTAASENLILESTSNAAKGYVLLNPTKGDVAIGTSTPLGLFHIEKALAGAELLVRVRHTDNTDPDSNVRVLLQAGGASGGDVFFHFDSNVTDQYSMGFANTDDSFRIAEGANLDSNVRFIINSTGRIGIGTDAPLAKTHIDQASTTGAIPVLSLDQADVSEEFINFLATAAASVVNPISTWTAGNSIQGFVRVGINNSFYWMPYYDAPSS